VTDTTPREYAPWVRIAGIVLTALAVCVATVFLGRWQYHRYEVRAEALHQYELGQQEDPHALNDLIPAGVTQLPDHSQWRETVLTGHFEGQSTTVLRNRPVDSQPTWQYLVWFDTDDGRSMLVNLGWIPLPGPEDDIAPPAYPTEDATITVIVRAWEDDDGNSGAGATRVSPAQVPTPTYEAVPAYGMLRQICAGGDCADVVVGQQTPLPELSTGPHLSYAWQWWVLAALTPVGAVIMIRREREDDEPQAPAGAPQDPDDAEPTLSKPRGRGRRLTDEEIEDAL